MTADLQPDRDVLDFLDLCGRFAALCETDPRDEPTRLRALRACMGELVVRVHRLPAIPFMDVLAEEDQEPEAVVRKRIGPRYRSLGSYNMVCFPDAVGEDPGVALGDAIDDLLDILRELQRGLSLWRDGDHRNAVAYWRWSFEVHWGDHAIEGLRAVHEAVKSRDRAR